MKKLTAKTFKYTHYMTLEEWKQWKENFDKSPKYLRNKGEETVKGYLNIREDSFVSIILGGFNWFDTPQGHDYWYKISGRTSPINQKICKK